MAHHSWLNHMISPTASDFSAASMLSYNFFELLFSNVYGYVSRKRSNPFIYYIERKWNASVCCMIRASTHTHKHTHSHAESHTLHQYGLTSKITYSVVVCPFDKFYLIVSPSFDWYFIVNTAAEAASQLQSHRTLHFKSFRITIIVITCLL